MFTVDKLINDDGVNPYYRVFNSSTGLYLWGKSLKYFKSEPPREDIFLFLQSLDWKTIPSPFAWGTNLVSDFESDYFVLYEWITGDPLDAFWKLATTDQQEACIKEILRALYLIHNRQLVHGDLSSKNILVDQNYRLLILDFDWSFAAHEYAHRRSGTIMNMPPEILEGTPPDGRSDLYSIALTLSNVISPLATETMSSHFKLHNDLVFSNIPSGNPWRYWLEKCCRKDPLDRWSSAKEAFLFAPFESKEPFFDKKFLQYFLKPYTLGSDNILDSILAITSIIPTPGGFIETQLNNKKETRIQNLWDSVVNSDKLLYHINNHGNITEVLLEGIFNKSGILKNRSSNHSTMDSRLRRFEDYYQAKQFDEAKRLGESVLQNDALLKTDRAFVQNRLGLIHWTTGQLEDANDYFKDAYHIYMANKDHEGLAKVLGNLGLVEATRKNHTEAMDHYLSALSEARILNDPKEVATLLLNLSSLAIEGNKVELAMSYLEEATYLFSELNLSEQTAAALFNHTLLLQYCGRSDQAIRVLDDFQSTSNSSTELTSLLQVRKLEIFIEWERFDEALPLAHSLLSKGIQLGPPNHNLLRRLLFHLSLFRAYPTEKAPHLNSLLDDWSEENQTTEKGKTAYLIALYYYYNDQPQMALDWLRKVEFKDGSHGQLNGIKSVLLELQIYKKLLMRKESISAKRRLEILLSEWSSSVPKMFRRHLWNHPYYRHALRLLDETNSEYALDHLSGSMSLTGVLRMLARISQSERFETLIEWSLASLVEFSRAERGFIILISEGVSEIEATLNFQKREIDDAEFEFSRSLVFKCLENGLPVLTTDAQHEPGAGQSVYDLNLLSVLIHPLTNQGKTVGVVYLDHRYRKGAFENVSLDLLGVITGQISASIVQRKMVNQLKNKNAELKDANRVIGEKNKLLSRKMKEETQKSTQAQKALEIVRLQLQSSQDNHRLIGQSKPMLLLQEKIQYFCSQKIPVLIQGESGTGKELVAKSLHFLGDRANFPFVPIHCGALPTGLVESELFGYVRGAFTGADRTKCGAFEAATGGTLFLDEIGTMDIGSQVKLLRVLQEKEIIQLGSHKPIPVDVRIIAASNENLEVLISEGKFREDLYYRINGAAITVPPLRERIEDLPILVEHFQAEWRDRRHPDTDFSHKIMAQWMMYHWPGNIRELINHIQYYNLLGTNPIQSDGASLLSNGKRGTDDFLQNYIAFDGTNASLINAVNKFEQDLIERAISLSGGNRTKAAKILGVSKSNLFYRLKKFSMTGP